MTDSSISDQDVRDRALEIGHAILKAQDAHCQPDPPFSTKIHLIIPASMPSGQRLCAKVRLKAVRAQLEGTRVPFNPLELRTFQLLDNRFAWAPKLIDFAPDTSWILREWFGTGTLRDLVGAPVPRAVLENVWQLFAEAFDAFHNRDAPWLIRDLKPQNIAMDGTRLALFDFNTAMSLEAVRSGSFSNRLGRAKDGNLYNPPELLTSQCPDARISSDYFAFATLVSVLITGASRPIWSNALAAPDTALAQYRAEYAAAIPELLGAARKAGLGEDRGAFLISSLNPVPDARPSRFVAKDR